MTVYRHAEMHPSTSGGGGARPNTNLAKAVCACPRVIRVARSTLGQAPITCGACGADFAADELD